MRNLEAGERTAADMRASTGNAAVDVGRLELADQASVAAFVESWRGPLHVLVNNAAVMALPNLWSGDGITANAVHPGGIDTSLSRHMPREELDRIRASGPRFKTVEQGAATSVLVATWPRLAGVGGRYFEYCNEAPVLEAPHESASTGVAAYAVDSANAERLWEASERLVGSAR